jgi:predicted nucleic acid-binding protein
MLYLLDTTALSDLIREHPKVLANLAELSPEDRVALCSIVRGEIRYGIERLQPGQRRTDLEIKASRLMAVLSTCPITNAVADYYGRIKASNQGKGLSLDENDLWIAATALSLDAVLVSRDSDFHRVDQLHMTDWTR